MTPHSRLNLGRTQRSALQFVFFIRADSRHSRALVFDGEATLGSMES